MRLLLPTTGLTLALSLALPGQTTSFTLPPGFLTTQNTNGGGNPDPYSVFLGAYTDGHYQIISGDLTGQGSRTITSLSLRRDNQYFYPDTHCVARSWLQVTLDIGASDYAKASTVFTANFTGQPSNLFKKATNWGDSSAPPSTSQTWGAFNMRFPFASPYVWDGKNDICIDFTFAGGKLTNSTASWNGATVNYVLLDGFTKRPYAGPLYNLLTTPACVASGQTYPPYFGTFIHTHGPTSSKPNQHEISHFMARGAKATVHVGSIGIYGDTNGVGVGTCEKLYLLKPQIYLYFTTDSSGGWGLPTYFVPYHVNNVGLAIYSQAAYTDPVTSVFGFTGGTRTTVPALPRTNSFKQLSVYNFSSTTREGFKGSSYVPIVRMN